MLAEIFHQRTVDNCICADKAYNKQTKDGAENKRDDGNKEKSANMLS